MTGMSLAIVKVEIGDTHYSTPPHHHDFYELAIVCRGTATHMVNQTLSTVSAGDVFFITPGYVHGYSNYQNYVMYNIIFNRDELNLPDREILNTPACCAMYNLETEFRASRGCKPFLTLNKEQLEQAVNICDAINAEQIRKEFAYKYRTLALFMELETFLLRCYQKQAVSRKRAVMDMANLITYLNVHYGEDISLEQMTEVAHVSERTLRRLFGDILGASPKAYLMDIRLLKAKQLLIESQMSITEISNRTGFCDSNYFSKQFHKKFSCSPKNIRKIHNKKTKTFAQDYL